MSIKYEVGKVKMRGGGEAWTVAVFNDGFSHIGVDDSCWVVLNGEDGNAGISSWIFDEAVVVALRELPPCPFDYQPLVEAMGPNHPSIQIYKLNQTLPVEVERRRRRS